MLDGEATAALVVSILKGETFVAEAARKHGLTVAEIEDWQERLVTGAENALRTRPKDDEALRRGAQGRADQEAAAEDRRARPRHRHLAGGGERPPFGPDDVRRVKDTMPSVSERRVCSMLVVPRSAVRQSAERSQRRLGLDEVLTARLARLDRRASNVRLSTALALLRCQKGVLLNRKAVYRVLAVKRWFVHQCQVTEIVGYEFALRGRAKEAERTLESACIARFGTLRPAGTTPIIRSDNGLIFQSRRFRAGCRDCRLRQEFITPYTPEQNGMIERFFRSLKEEGVWQRSFVSFAEARRAIRRWIDWYNDRRPHQALGYRSPRRYHADKLERVA